MLPKLPYSVNWCPGNGANPACTVLQGFRGCLDSSHMNDKTDELCGLKKVKIDSKRNSSV